MKKSIFAGLLLAASAHASACDLCGCSANSQYLGILPMQYKHFIGIQYNYYSFTASQPSPADPQEMETGNAVTKNVQVWGRYSVNKNLQLLAFVPYREIYGIDEGQSYRNAGLGDVSVLAQYAVLRREACDRKVTHLAFAGLGAKAPTGNNKGLTALEEEGLPNVQPGTGAWDGIVSVNYTAGLKKGGLNVDAAYTLTTANNTNYKYGNKLNAGLMGFYKVAAKNITLLPQAGLRYDFVLKDYSDYQQRILNHTSGGSIFFFSAGIQGYWKHFGARAIYSVPVSQNYVNGHVTAENRFEAGLFYLIKPSL